MKIPLVLSFAVFLTLSLGCSGGGSGDGGGTMPPVSGTPLGSRAVPGYQLAVSTNLPPAAGAARIVTLRVTADIAAPAIAQISVALSDNAPETVPVMTSGTTVPGSSTDWTWPMMLPADLVGKRVVFRIQDAVTI